MNKHCVTAVIALASLLSPLHTRAAATDDFVITVKTDNTGTSSNTQFTIPINSGYSYNYNVDCDDDGNDEATAETSNYTCNYNTAGTYTIPSHV